jgi:hypothetical protein
MKATLLFQQKYELDDGSTVEMVLWDVPQPVEGSVHRFKYRLYLGKDGKRIVGYDNERGKGDHRHFRGREATYRFTTPEQLMADFLADVEAMRKRR